MIDGYQTLFAEAAAQGRHDVIVVPVGVGSLAAAAARHGAQAGARVVGAEPETAACLTASLRAGAPTAVPTPGTAMAGLDCAEISAAAWPVLRDGIHATVTVSEDAMRAALRELAAAGLAIGESGSAPLAALRALAADAREAVGPRALEPRPARRDRGPDGPRDLRRRAARLSRPRRAIRCGSTSISEVETQQACLSSIG